MRKGLFHNTARKRGFTMMEVLTVVGIVAILCAIAIPSIISISRSLKFKQANDYAQSIFLAAQANLTEMKDDSELQRAIENAIFTGNEALMKDASGSYEKHDQYLYVSSDSHGELYNVVLPVGSVESTIRDQHVIIEFNPHTANVYAVFYWEEDDSESYEYDKIVYHRDNEETRKELQLGYYCGTEIVTQKLDMYNISADLSFDNGEEGLVVVKIPTSVIVDGHSYNILTDNLNRYMNGLSVSMTVMGDLGGTITLPVKAAGDPIDSRYCFDYIPSDSAARVICVTFPLDSLIDSGSFANLSAGKDADLSALTDADFTGKILPGDNVSISVDVTFTPSGDDPIINIESAAIAGVNPMFDSLTVNPDYPGAEGSAEKQYILAVSNGRNLQNLNALAPSIAAQVETVVFGETITEAPAPQAEQPAEPLVIDWGKTVTYYNEKYGTGSGKRYENAAAEAPARALPYFVPIQNANLFGKGAFDTNDTLNDANATADNATIEGNGAEIYNLNIRADKYQVPTAAYYANTAVSYDFTGLFSYVNTTVDGINIVNPKIIGADFTTYANPATGALIGAAGVSARITNCGVYIDTAADDFDRSKLNLVNFLGAEAQYGVSGHGAVGGLVGYARSNDNATKDLTADSAEVTFVKCFAAVPVYGEMQASGAYGYTNGVGGLIGYSCLTNFYSCYSSGNVTAAKPNLGTKLEDVAIEYLGIDRSGADSWGAGGFVGTSHGTCYTNCFAVGNVSGKETEDDYGMGGFVGIMCYDSGFGAQHTVFTNCYAVGTVEAEVTVKVKENNQDVEKQQMLIESFSGGNAIIAPNESIKPPIPDNQTNTENQNVETNYADAANWENPAYQAYYLFNNSWYLGGYMGSTGDGSVNVQTAAEGEEAVQPENTTVDTENVYSQKCAKPALYQDLVKATEASGIFHNMPAWRNATAAATHPYEIAYEGRTYPFAMLADLHYYGDWPAEPAAVGLAYYEVYNENTDGGLTYAYGYYFDRDSTSTLRDDELSVWDGYAIMSAKKISSATVAGNTVNINNPDQEVTIGANKYYVYRLSDSVMRDAAKVQNPENGNSAYYTTVSVVIDGKPFDLYFNPNVALSQINPVAGSDSAVKPDGVPEQIYIRTARQINAVAENMKHYWSEECHYVQLTNINFQLFYEYTEVKSKSNGPDYVKRVTAIAPIGTSSAPFNGTYSAAGDSQLQIIGHIPLVVKPGEGEKFAAAGLFGVLGEKAAVKNLMIVPDNLKKSSDKIVSNTTLIEGDLLTSTETANIAVNVGLFAAVNHGTVENVDILINDGVTVKSDADAMGLLAGINTGNITNCDLLFAEDDKVLNQSSTDLIVFDDNLITDLIVDSKGGVLGLLVGRNVGNLTECNAAASVISQNFDNAQYTVKKPASVALYGATAGGLVGYSEKEQGRLRPVLTDCSVAETFFQTKAADLDKYYYPVDLDLTFAPLCPEDMKAADEADTNIPQGVYGGLIGSARNTQITSVLTEENNQKKTEIYLGNVNAAGHYFGGAVGAAENCDLLRVKVTVGESAFAPPLDGSSQVISEPVTVKATVAAGLVARAEDLKLTDSAVDINGTLYGTELAAGAVGMLNWEQPDSEGNIVLTKGSSEITNVTVTLDEKAQLELMSNAVPDNSEKPGKAKLRNVIRSDKDAAGFVGLANGQLADCYICGVGTIFGAERSAGFAAEIEGFSVVDRCAVSPARYDAKLKTQNFKNSYLVIGLKPEENATSYTYTYSRLAVGFAVENSAAIQQSRALATVYAYYLSEQNDSSPAKNIGRSAGFVMSNFDTGLVSTSFANVDNGEEYDKNGNLVDSKHIVFAAQNAGQVMNCYGWSTAGTLDEFVQGVNDNMIHYAGCYFAVMTAGDDQDTVILYDTAGEESETVLTFVDLMNPDVLDMLGEYWDTAAENHANDFKTYSYTMNSVYPYPMFTDHHGDWAEPFGVVYYEVYEDGVGVYTADFSQNEKIVFKQSGMTGSDNADRGYALYLRGLLSDNVIDQTAAVQTVVQEYDMLYEVLGFPAGSGYQLYKIETDDTFQVRYNGSILTITPGEKYPSNMVDANAAVNDNISDTN